MVKEEVKKEFIDNKRTEIISELREYLKEVNHFITIDQILVEVYEDDGEDAFDHLVIKLAENDRVSDLELAQEFAMELFNYFPRKSLGGKSMVEEMLFGELKKMEEAFQDFKNGTATSNYSYSLSKKKVKDLERQ